MTPDQRKQTQQVEYFYQNIQREDRNLALAGDSGIINHHFGIGQVDLTNPDGLSQSDITQIINQLEVNQTRILMETMGPIKPTDVVLDAGSGRGGTAFTINRTTGAMVRGITISPYQAGFSQNLADNYWKTDRVNFSVMNMLDLGFPRNTIDHVITNETTMYVSDLQRLFSGFRNVLKPDGRYTLATWCVNHEFKGRGDITRRINRHYPGTRMHTRQEYLHALSSAGFRNIRLVDLTTDAIPHWQIRSMWSEASGIESAYLEGHTIGKINYIMASAQK